MTKPELVKDFMCRCRPERAEECDAIMADVLARLSEGYETPATPENLLSRVVTSLNWDYDGASIEGIHTDQWSVVISEKRGYGDVESKDFDEQYPVEFRTHVQCDRVEDGIARTWQIYADRFPQTKEEE